MFNSAVLEVAIGLVFCFASVALMASAASEALASFLGLRSKTLLTGVKQLLNDPKFDGLAQAVYNHALVHPRGDGNLPAGATFAQIQNPPAYIDAKGFAEALIEHLQQVPGDMNQLNASVQAIQDPQLRTLLQGMVARAQGDAAILESQLADWFDSGMDRLSGLYKRNAQVWTFVFGLLLATILNVDSIHLARELWKQPSQTTQAELAKLPGSGARIEDIEKSMISLPVGAPYDLCNPAVLAWNIGGLLLTASAAMFGAPFWFDLLQNLVQLRSTGPKPNAVAKQKAAT